jgi:hypothetical protein
MDFEFEQPTELEKQRTEYFAARAKPNMTMDEYIRLNEEILEKFPLTEEDRVRSLEAKKNIPEFVL